MKHYYLAYDNDHDANMVFALERNYRKFESIFKKRFYEWVQFGPDDLHYTSMRYVQLSEEDANKIKNWINDPNADCYDAELDAVLKKAKSAADEFFSTSPAFDWWDALRNAAPKFGLSPDDVGFGDVPEDAVNKELKKIIRSWFK